jgi:hypothetical protein
MFPISQRAHRIEKGIVMGVKGEKGRVEWSGREEDIMAPGGGVDIGHIPFFMSCVWRGGREKAGMMLAYGG